jgi:hypothetical protein
MGFGSTAFHLLATQLGGVDFVLADKTSAAAARIHHKPLACEPFVPLVLMFHGRHSFL